MSPLSIPPKIDVLQRAKQFTTSDIARANAAKKQAAFDEAQRALNRGDGLRMRLSLLKGHTRGDAAKVLKTPYFFQCPPLEEFTHQHGFASGVYTNYEGTEFQRRGGRKLITFSVNTLVVEWGAFVVEHQYDTEALVKSLRRLSDAGWPFHFLATHQYNDTPELEMNATLDEVTVTEKAGEADARYLTLSFTEWRNPAVSRRGEGSNRPGKDNWPKKVTVLPSGKAKYPSNVNGGKEPSADITFAKLSQDAYGQSDLGGQIARAQKPPIKDFGSHTPIIKHPRFKKGGTITLSEPTVGKVSAGGNPSDGPGGLNT